MVSTDNETAGARRAGPAPGLVAAAYAFVFLAGLLLISPFGGKSGFPGPGEPLNVMLAFFQKRAPSVRVFGALQFGAAIPLGIFTSTMSAGYGSSVSELRAPTLPSLGDSRRLSA
jgi:hypothetical protein